jgi:hypothetical protein
MLWLFFSLSALANEELELNAVRKLEESIKAQDHLEVETEEFEEKVQSNRYKSPNPTVKFRTILESGIEHGHIKSGSVLIRLKDNKSFELTEPFYGKFYRLQDEFGFKYVQSNNGKCEYKIKSQVFNSIEPQLDLYVSPKKYTPAPKAISRADYDTQFKLKPDLSILSGIVQGQYMRDLFNDNKASTGLSTQYGIGFFADWKIPIKGGFAVHYEKTNYSLKGNGKVTYSSISFGPQFKTKEFSLANYPIHFLTQFRFGPFSRANAETVNGNVDFKFNSADFLVSAQHPIENRLGKFCLGVFFQSQWLNIKDQKEIVSLNTSNQTNKSFGLSFTQVFE